MQTHRAGKPAAYPDQAIYAAFACRALGLRFADLDGGSGLAFRVSSPTRSVAFGGGRCSYYPQNNATAATLANDKYLTNVVLDGAGIAHCGGRYFFLTDRHRAHRPSGHDSADAVAYLRDLGGRAFVKPLTGSRGDFAEAIGSETALAAYLDDVAPHYDSVLMQPVYAGREYRLFLLDDDLVYSARKYPPVLVGDGVTPLRDLLARREQDLHAHGVSSATAAIGEADDARVLTVGEQYPLHGRLNRSAGGAMVFETPRLRDRAVAQARAAMRALGLRAAGVDLFTDLAGDADAIRVIEVNANPAIRFLEDSGRDDLILTIWRHTLSAAGLLDV